MIDSGFTQSELNDEIYKYLKMMNIQPIFNIPNCEKKRGNTLCYPEGTIAAINGKNKVTFFLLAISDFNENNNSQSSKEKIIDSIYSLIKFSDEIGQGNKIYVPLMGTGLSRANLSHIESLNAIKRVYELYCNKIHCEVDIVIYNKEKDKVSLLNY